MIYILDESTIIPEEKLLYWMIKSNLMIKIDQNIPMNILEVSRKDKGMKFIYYTDNIL